jgi:hypothetical protein
MKYQAANVADFRENRRVDEDGLSEEVRVLRSDIQAIKKYQRHGAYVNISCPYGTIMDGEDTFEMACSIGEITTVSHKHNTKYNLVPRCSIGEITISVVSYLEVQ